MPLPAVVIMVLALSGIQPDLARSTTLDFREYLAALDDLERAIAAAAAPDEARTVAAAFPDRLWVTLDAQVIVVDTGWIERAIDRSAAAGDTWPAARDRIRQRLETMAASALASAFAPDRPPKELLQSVLARPEFQRATGSRRLEDLRKRIAGWLLQILNGFAPSRVSGHVAAVVFAWIGSVTALLAATLWLATTLRRRADAAWLEPSGATPPPSSAGGLARQALDAARDGDFREAVRYAYHATVRKLEDQGVWTIDESRTPREYLSLLEETDPRVAVLSDVTGRFEQVWYGHRPATSDDARELTAHLLQLGCVQESERAIARS